MSVWCDYVRTSAPECQRVRQRLCEKGCLAGERIPVKELAQGSQQLALEAVVTQSVQPGPYHLSLECSVLTSAPGGNTCVCVHVHLWL